MKKAFKYISLLMITFTFSFLLMSCSNTNFYKTFKALGAQIEEENCFVEVTIDEFNEMKNDESKNDFVILLVSSDSAKSTNPISIIQYEVDNQNRSDVKVYVFDVVDGVNKASKGEEYRNAFGVKEITSSNGFVAIGIQDGNLLFDTSNPNDYCDNFKTTSDEVNIHAVAQFIIENKINNN